MYRSSYYLNILLTTILFMVILIALSHLFSTTIIFLILALILSIITVDLEAESNETIIIRLTTGVL